MLIVSSDTGSRPFGVILTVRRPVFICGETEVMVPWRIVPSWLVSYVFGLSSSHEYRYGGGRRDR